MKVILLDNINNVGLLGEEVQVKPGYARNFLIPRSKAVMATKRNIEIFKEQKIKLKDMELEKRNKAAVLVEKINVLKSITIKAKSGIEGKLFGSIGARDIASVIIKSLDININKSQIRLPNNDALKAIGTYSVKIHIYNEIFAMLDVNIVGVSII